MNELSDLVYLEIRIPRESEVTPETAAQFFSNLPVPPTSFLDKITGSVKQPFSFEIAVFDQTIRFFVVFPKEYQTYFESQLTAQYPGAILIPSPDYLANWKDGALAYGQLSQTQPHYLSIRTYKDFKDVDALSSVLGTMAKANSDERMLVQFVVVPAGSSWQRHGYGLIAKGIPGAEGKVLPHPQAKLIEAKINQVGFRVGIRLLVTSPNESASKSLLRNLAGSFGSVASGDGNSLRLTQPLLWNKKKLLESIYLRGLFGVGKRDIFNVSELATLYHLPGVTLSSIRNIVWGRNMGGEPPENLPIALNLSDEEKRHINFFARTEYKNKDCIFGIKREDRRRHVYIVGKTGVGKSTLIANMAINDIRNGEGVAIIDPHGDLSELLLEYIPSYRINDVVYLDPANTSRAFHLNPLEVKNPAYRELIASGIVSIFYKLYAHSWGPRLEYILRNAILTLVSRPGSTLMDVQRLLGQESYRQKVVDKLTDPVLRNFWIEEYNKMSPQLRAEAISPILNKVGQFLSSTTIRNIIGFPESTIDLEDIMNNGKILLVNLSQGRLGEDNSALLGAMLITKLQLAAMNRVNVAEEARRDFYLYVDEFQNFATNSFIKILSEARKYRLNLTLANQYTAQVDEDVSKAIFGNVGTLVTFLVGAEDSRVLTKEFGGVYTEDDLVSLGNHQIVLKIAIDNLTSTPFFATTLPLPRNKTESREKVLLVSNERYTRPVEAIVLSDEAPAPAPTSVTKKERPVPKPRIAYPHTPPPAQKQAVSGHTASAAPIKAVHVPGLGVVRAPQERHQPVPQPVSSVSPAQPVRSQQPHTAVSTSASPRRQKIKDVSKLLHSMVEKPASTPNSEGREVIGQGTITAPSTKRFFKKRPTKPFSASSHKTAPEQPKPAVEEAKSIEQPSIMKAQQASKSPQSSSDDDDYTHPVIPLAGPRAKN